MRARTKLNATLAQYVIHDLSTMLRIPFKFPDRLSPAEARRVQDALAKSTELRKAVAQTEALPGGKKLVAMYRDVLQHFILDHKADTAGEPAPWDVPAHRPTDAANPFAGMVPEHAASIIEWATTRPDYGKIRLDRHHPEHAAIETQTKQLFEAASARPPASGASAQPPAPAAPPARAAAPAAPGAPAELGSDRAATIRGLLLKMPRTDPQRRVLLDEMIELTQTAPGAAAAPAAPAAPPAKAAAPSAPGAPDEPSADRAATIRATLKTMPSTDPQRRVLLEELVASTQTAPAAAATLAA